MRASRSPAGYRVLRAGCGYDLLGLRASSRRGTLRGADEFLEFRASWTEPYDDFIYERLKIIDAGGNRVVVTLHQRGKPHGSDSWVTMDYGLVYTVEEGLITRG